jgi:hypothetical protein
VCHDPRVRVRHQSAHMRCRYKRRHMRDPFILVTALESPQNATFADALNGRAVSIYYHSHGGELHAIPKPGWNVRTQRYQCSALTSAVPVCGFPVNKPECRLHARFSKGDSEEHEGRTNGLNAYDGCGRMKTRGGQDEGIVQGDQAQTSMAVPSGKASRCAAGMSRHVACRMTSRDFRFIAMISPTRQPLIPNIYQ